MRDIMHSGTPLMGRWRQTRQRPTKPPLYSPQHLQVQFWGSTNMRKCVLRSIQALGVLLGRGGTPPVRMSVSRRHQGSRLNARLLADTSWGVVGAFGGGLLFNTSCRRVWLSSRSLSTSARSSLNNPFSIMSWVIVSKSCSR